MHTILIAIIYVTSIGIICAIVLSVASKLMHVKTDDRITLLLESLPGVNCGVCGYPGCSGYASALLSGDAQSNLCTPGGEEVLKKISVVLGVEASSIEQKKAIVFCSGDFNSRQKKMDYIGIESCKGANQLFGGDNHCAFGCLGYGDCKTVCPTNAIYIQDGLAYIEPRLCTGCGLCVKECPKKIISVEKSNIAVFVLCKNIEKGAITRKKCDKGCIACTKCVKECPQGAIVIEDFLAKIDYSKCDNCRKCAETCIQKCITNY